MYAYDDVVIKDGYAYYRKIYYYEGCVFIHTKTLAVTPVQKHDVVAPVLEKDDNLDSGCAC